MFANAENRTISWDPVSTYTDNTPIEQSKIVTYMAYWSIDEALTNLNALDNVATTRTRMTFNPDAQRMTRLTVIYFTARAFLNTGEQSDLSPAYAWRIPRRRRGNSPFAEIEKNIHLSWK
jgi:hypothetical protein